jgi:hypothetical protein
MPFTPPPPLRAGLFGARGPAAQPGAAAKPKPPPGLRGLRFEHRIGVQAPAAVIWSQIYDLARWSEWNPLYPEAAGEVRIGGVLTITLALAGQPSQVIRPVVLDWVPDEQLLWRLTMLGGMIRTTRYIEIDALGPANCIVSNGEIFGGLMGPSLGKRVGPSVRRGFLDMNQALKDRAEAAWRAEAPVLKSGQP